jgi:ubiquinone biosynthesis protein Coq4
MNPHHPKKQILNQTRRKKILNEDAISELIKDNDQFKKIVDDLSDDFKLEEKLHKALQSIEVPKDLKKIFWKPSAHKKISNKRLRPLNIIQLPFL